LPGLPAEGAWLGLLVALGSGLLIGIERERRKGDGPQRALAGVRSFTLAALAGAIAQTLEQPWLVAIGAALILALIAIGYARERSDDPGVTTELALFVTYLLGVAAIGRPAAAAAGAVLVAALLAARSRLHRFATQSLTAAELRDGLILAGAALVLLPMLPDAPLAWLGGLNPQRIWGLAVLIMALQGGGHVARRWLGARRGLVLAGLAGGFTSSTATIAALGALSRRHPAQRQASVAAALSSTMATFIQFALVAAAIHLPALALLGLPLAAGLAASALATGFFYLRARNDAGAQGAQGRAFSLWQATGFALGLAAIGALLGLVEEHYGAGATQLGTALAGFADAHAAGASVLGLAADARMPLPAAVWACLLGLSTNTASKLIVAFAAGGAAYGTRVGAGLLAALAAAWAGALVSI
jgi:uncharacterized membrane protein (DUF4010 family)